MSTVDLDSQKGKNSGGGYTWDLRQHFCNPFGMLHGGAAAMSVEHSAALAHTDNTDTVCTRLDLSYLSSVANKRTAAIVFHNAWGDKVCENKGCVCYRVFVCMMFWLKRVYLYSIANFNFLSSSLLDSSDIFLSVLHNILSIAHSHHTNITPRTSNIKHQPYEQHGLPAGQERRRVFRHPVWQVTWLD